MHIRKGWVWLTLGGLVALFLIIAVVLYLLGGPDESALERLTSISIIFLTLSAVLVVLLLGALVGVSVWLALLLKDHIIPLLEQLGPKLGQISQNAVDTAVRVKGTTEFVSEEVVRPVISAYSTVAGLRAMIKTVTGRDRKR
ncbi:hypothetical protein [Nitrolancea hollandica]|uniref:Uncharacterized protein n=1 Tax=Nitrolancea hollandica Lb TaxID=1129897 RepID=I4EGL2_9BACT|nr:hypothetical protein [Nitrolancea hollandica]CCF83824.1 conserved exported hypothetical protein [Nitrolancea hollandica Lb]